MEERAWQTKETYELFFCVLVRAAVWRLSRRIGLCANGAPLLCAAHRPPAVVVVAQPRLPCHPLAPGAYLRSNPSKKAPESPSTVWHSCHPTASRYLRNDFFSHTPTPRLLLLTSTCQPIQDTKPCTPSGSIRLCELSHSQDFESIVALTIPESRELFNLILFTTV
jgi:hypothetical protein